MCQFRVLPEKILALVAASFAVASSAIAFDSNDFRLSATGADPALTRQLTNASLVRQAIEDERTSADELLAAARAEYRQMLGVLYGEGYFGPVISVSVNGREAADLSPLSPPSTIQRIEISVDPGEVFRFSRAEIEPRAPGTELPEEFRPGETARVNTIRAAAAAGVRGWRNIGHAKADLSREDIAADHATNLLSAQLGIAPGPKLRFGRLRVSGNERVTTKRIRDIAGLPREETYSPEDVEKAADRLRRSGAFRSVTLRDADEVGPGDLIDIHADLVEAKRRRLGAGIELSSVDGLRVSSFWMHRNLLGGAERLRFELDIENIGATTDDNGVDYRLTGSFKRPAVAGPDYDLYVNTELAREDEPGYLSTSFQLGAGVTRIFDDELEGSIGLLYRAGRVEDSFGDRDYSLFGLPIALTWDKRDDKLDATDGFYLSGLVQPFVGITEIDSGALIRLDGRAYRSLGERLVLAGRAQFGSLIGPTPDNAPPDYLFFAGGGGSVRGQPFQAIGGSTSGSTVIGGNSFVALAAEVRAQVRGNIGLVGFYDTGYVGTEELYDGSGQWISGAGLGVRYDTGLGPLRVDIATPVDGGPSDAAKVQLYIGIGQAF